MIVYISLDGLLLSLLTCSTPPLFIVFPTDSGGRCFKSYLAKGAEGCGLSSSVLKVI